MTAMALNPATAMALTMMISMRGIKLYFLIKRGVNNSRVFVKTLDLASVVSVNQNPKALK